MQVKTWFFLVTLGFFIYQFTPFSVLLTSGYFSFVYIVANAYIIVFIIFVLIENYEKIKEAVEKSQTKITDFIVFKNSNPCKDLVRFILISIIIAFCLDIILTKLADQPLVEYASKYIPGLSDFKDLTTLSLPESLNNTLTKNQNITGIVGEIGLPNLMDVKIGAIKNLAVTLIGPTIGPLILFFLRQISYKKRRSNKTENPGSRILFIFITGMMIVLSFDVYTDSMDGFSSFSQSSESSGGNGSNNSKIQVYGIRSVALYFISFVPSPFYWVTAISIWAFDWYLFSRMWSKDLKINW